MTHSADLHGTRGSGHGLLVVNLLAQISFGLLAMTMCLPSMPQWGEVFDSSQASVQLTLSVYALAFGLFQLLYGPLSDRHGRKRIILVGLGVALLGSVLAALSQSLSLLVVARFLQGAGSAAGMVVGRAMVQDLFLGAERTRIMAYVGMVMGLCPPLAVLIGGQLHVRLGWQASFVWVAAIALCLMVAAWRGLPVHTPQPPTAQHWMQEMASAYMRLLQERKFLLYVAILSMNYGTFYAYLGGAPMVLGGFGVGPEGIGWYMLSMSVSYMTGSYLTSRWIQRQGERRIMALGQVLAWLGIGLMLALGIAGWSTPLAFVIPVALLGMGHGFLMPPTLAGTVGVLPAVAGAAAAVAGLMQQVMGAVGGYSVGLIPQLGSAELGGLMLGFTLCALLAQVLLHRR